jgi:hypothetical protein
VIDEISISFTSEYLEKGENVLFGGSPPNFHELPRHNSICPAEQQELLHLDGVELNCGRQHFGAI